MGPMSATMAILYDMGWNLANPCHWTDPSGQQWTPDFSADKKPFVELVGRFASALVWQHASEGWCGKGLQHGVDWTASSALYRHIALVNKREGL